MKNFYLSPADWPDYQEGADKVPFSCTLTGQEARHLVKVLRLRPGTQVRLFDGTGRHGIFSLVSTEFSRATLQCDEMLPPVGRPVLTLAMGWSKSVRRGWFLERSVEFGVAGLIFWQAQYSQGHVPDTPKKSWHSKLISGAKQSDNIIIPEMQTCPGGLSEIVEQSADYAHRFVFWEDKAAPALLSPRDISATQGDVLAVLGPEAGFAPDEIALLTGAGFACVSLGSHILRWDTAAMFVSGLFWWGGHVD